MALQGRLNMFATKLSNTAIKKEIISSDGLIRIILEI
jgi:hypothetical protein